MLPQLRRPVCLAISSIDLPFTSEVETFATVYQRDEDRFHLVLTEPLLWDRTTVPEPPELVGGIAAAMARLLWIEIAPQRVTLTMQGNGPFSYRHCWEQGGYGTSRFWLYSRDSGKSDRLCLRNYTRSVQVNQNDWPLQVLIDYDLYSGDLLLGQYVLTLEMLGGW